MRLVKQCLFFAIALCVPGMVSAQSISGSANFGTVYGNSNTQVCFQNNLGPQYYPSSSGLSFLVPGGNVYVPLQVINPGQTCVTAQFTQGGSDGSLSGSGSAPYRNTNGGTATLEISTSGQSYIQLATAAPKYQVLSILYTPPGDASSTGFSNTTSAGSTTSLANNFSTSDTVTFSGGFLGGTAGVTFGVGTSSSDSKAYSVTYQATSGSQLNSVSQVIDHSQDQIYLWLNPGVTVRQTGSTTGYYNVGTVDSSGNFLSSNAMDVVNVNIAGLKNPSQIPLSVLLPQTPQQGITLPGLANVCANPLPPAQCTQANACGCTPADFATIVQQDELANVTDQTAAPSSIDPNRFAYVSYITLEGPQQQGAGPVRNSFSLTDSQMSGTTYSNGTSYSTGFTVGWKTTPFLGWASATQTRSLTGRRRRQGPAMGQGTRGQPRWARAGWIAMRT